MGMARRSTVVQWIARAIVRLVGWRTDGHLPDERRYVLVCVPHTSTWDLWLTLLFSAAFGIRVRWLGKHTLFWWPNGVLLTWLGGVAVDRRGGTEAVSRVARLFQSNREFVLVVSPEGAKRWKPHWRTGFWYIAQAANVPMVLAALDWKRKTCRVGPVVTPTRIEDDLAVFREALAEVTARHPDRFGPVALPPNHGVDAAEPPGIQQVGRS
jgi:1-acyl-sn-glycerol-3-phosphate acyltransferase